MTLVAAAHQALTFTEIVAWTVGVIVAIAAFLAALAGIGKSIRWAYRWIRYKALPWAKRAVKLVDDLTGLPEEVAEIKSALNEHIETSTPKADLLDYIANELGVIKAEVKNNGGGSLKDSTHRIERALGLPEPTKRPITGPIETQ